MYFNNMVKSYIIFLIIFVMMLNNFTENFLKLISCKNILNGAV